MKKNLTKIVTITDTIDIEVNDENTSICSENCQYLEQYFDCEMCRKFGKELDSKSGLRCEECLSYGK